MKLRKFTKRKSAIGKPYPQCQRAADGKQCEKPVYADGSTRAMTNRERIWRRACSWVRGWQGGKSTPTPEMAYIAGWQAAMRERFP